MRIAVAGGTGLVGALLVGRLARAGHDVVVLARATGVDLLAGVGVEDALDGSDTVVDVLSTPAQGTRSASRFFTTTTRVLLDAGRRTGVGHHVTLSIVGVDDARSGYHRGKRDQEAVLTASPTPWSLLRATQFHEFPGQLLARTTVGPVGVVPRMRVAPVAVTAVADRLAAIATGEPLGRVRDLAGPAEEDLVAMARAVAGRLGVRRVLGVPLPGHDGRRLRRGGLLPGPHAERAGPTFTAWLDAWPEDPPDGDAPGHRRDRGTPPG